MIVSMYCIIIMMYSFTTELFAKSPKKTIIV
jgi:hypothetical protein